MFNLFKIEWLKIKTYRTFWVLFITFLLMYPLTFYFSASKFMEHQTADMKEEMLKSFLGLPFVFPKVWHSASWFGGLFFVMIGMLFILLITNETQYRTHRQNIIDGWDRMDFLKAKLMLLIFFVLVSTVLVFLSGLLVGLVFSDTRASLFDGVQYVGYFALMAVVYLAVAFLVAMLIKRTGLAIIIYFAFVCIADNLLWLIFTLRDSQLGYYMPLETVDSLVPNPFKPGMLEKRTVSDWSLVSAAALYISLFGFIVTTYFKKADLKT
jgi:ABC-2 type transport system permease protein